ncbi:hypothetical protein Tco_1378301 [Tanacetum coccineum]
MSTLTFADTHNMVAFLEKPTKSDGFHEIINFLNANQIHYALTVNPILYTSCIEQFWTIAKANTINGERQLQALVDKKRVIIMESSSRSDLHLADVGGIDCLSTATIFEELARIGFEKPSQSLTFYKAFFSPQWKFLIHTITQCLSAKSTAWNEFNSTMASAIICLATNQKFNFSKYIFDAMLGDMSHHKKIYVNPSHTKKTFANMKREGKDFSGRLTPLFATMMVQATQDEGVDSGIPTDSQQTPITTQPSSSKPQKKQSRRKQRKETKVPQDETHHDDSVPIPSNDPLLSAKEIAGLKKRVQRLERKKKSRTTGLQRLRKISESSRVESSEDMKSLGAQEDASKQGRIKIIDETQGRLDDAKMFDIDDLHDDEIVMPLQSVAPSTTAVSPPIITEVEITLAQTLAKLKSAKSKVVIQEPVHSTTTTTPSTIPKAKGITFRDAGESTTRTPTSVSSSSIKDKGKAKMDEPEVPLKKKDQIALDEEMARNLKAQIQAELIEEERLARKKEEESNIALIE